MRVQCSRSKDFFAYVLRDSGREGGRVIILYPFCTLFCYLLLAAPSNAYQRPDKNCQWFCCFTDNSSVFVQGDLTHQGSLLCCCCKALKRLCLCCKALKGEPLNPYKYSVVVLTFDFVPHLSTVSVPLFFTFTRWIGSALHFSYRV